MVSCAYIHHLLGQAPQAVRSITQLLSCTPVSPLASQDILQPMQSSREAVPEVVVVMSLRDRSRDRRYYDGTFHERCEIAILYIDLYPACPCLCLSSFILPWAGCTRAWLCDASSKTCSGCTTWGAPTDPSPLPSPMGSDQSDGDIRPSNRLALSP